MNIRNKEGKKKKTTKEKENERSFKKKQRVKKLEKERIFLKLRG